ncbi:FHA domain-containing protein [Planctomyces sp. SH-PL62]|uniref:FHA domain-containing protein n=1 Tax=Planctomyces sp. SH-PL62 TaxID=1636152 RepID=UPI00078C10EA|nr:FHA domain-containing protein [Planctomyces sp. SH-PL62]AMV37287.1 FHA domain protein [Planctomyces sp. SH-PL62]
MATTATKTRWILEIAKGREPGRRYDLDRDETTIGNGPWAPAYLSLADQEGESPRRMAVRQAAIVRDRTRDGLSIRDLDSPGGTFVNRQRLFSGQDRALAPGDVVQVGAVQLVIKHEHASNPESEKPARPAPPPAPTATTSGPRAKAAPPPQPPKPEPARPPASRTAPLAAPYIFPDGSTSRSWDDFLTISSQRWAMIRDELASGRLGEHLRKTGRGDLLPRREPGWTADETLDDWLGRLPTTRPSAPELDVHPDALVIPAVAVGGMVRRSLRIANVGYRILRPTVAIEPAAGMPDAIRLAPEWRAKPLLTIDETEIVVEIEPPEDAFDVTLGAIVVVAGGKTRRVGVRVERPRSEKIPEGPDATVGSGPGWSPILSLGERLEGLSIARRLWTFPLTLLILRGLIGLGNRLPFLASGGELRLVGASALPALVGGMIGWAVGSRGGFLDAIASTFAGVVVGVLASSLIFATIRSVEPIFGSPFFAALALGLALAGVSCLAFPPRREERP